MYIEVHHVHMRIPTHQEKKQNEWCAMNLLLTDKFASAL